MSLWRNLSISDRYNTWKLYRQAYPEMSHRDIIKHFDGGGVIGEKPNSFLTANNEYDEFPYDGTSKYKGGYDSKTANEIYKPDETGHMPSVDYRTGIWLKDKDYPTSWMELKATTLNLELNKEVGSPYLNENGRLQYRINKE
jgi:hypothetical protein